MKRRGCSALVLVFALGCDEQLPPYPEVVIVADTRLPVPLAMSRLRIDLYAIDGTWLDTADIARPDPRDWPVSFSVYADDTSASRSLRVRLRGYSDGRTRDYRGENPFTWGGPIGTTPPKTGSPRLIRDGKDITPALEPDPINAIDRLLLVDLPENRRGKINVVLEGECLGTSVLLGSETGPILGEAATCEREEKIRYRVDRRPAEIDDGARGPSVAGAWLSDSPCPSPNDDAARVCIPGGATVIGATDPTSNAVLSARPVRVLGVRRFFMDRREVTVSRFRQALAEGFAPLRMPVENNGPLGAGAIDGCTWSAEPLDRDDMSLGCVSWVTARAYCHHVGGDLPSEVQWEHAATVAGRSAKTKYPWGNEQPTCDRAAYGRSSSGPTSACYAEKGDLPPQPWESDGDRSPLGVIGLFGGLAEWALDETSTYADACWGNAPVVSPRCGALEDLGIRHVVRGGSFRSDAMPMTVRLDQDPVAMFNAIGFRCVYDGS